MFWISLTKLRRYATGLLLPLLCLAEVPSHPPDPELLTYDEIIQLYQDETPPPELQQKLHNLLTTPFVRNTASEAGVMPLKPGQPQIGKILRVAQWNIERGLEFDAVRFAFSDPRQFNALMEDKGSKSRRRGARRKFARRSAFCSKPICWS